jgi:hypothetical protein
MLVVLRAIFFNGDTMKRYKVIHPYESYYFDGLRTTIPVGAVGERNDGEKYYKFPLDACTPLVFFWFVEQFDAFFQEIKGDEKTLPGSAELPD